MARKPKIEHAYIYRSKINNIINLHTIHMGQKTFMCFDNHMPELTFLAGEGTSRLNSPLRTVHHECSDLETL